MTTQQDRLAVIGVIAGRTKDIGRAVNRIRTNGAAFDKLVHDTGLAIIISSMPQEEGGHKDASKALGYIQALEGGASRRRVIAWLKEFSNIRVSCKVADDKSMVWSYKLLKPDHKDYRPARPIEADALPFWKLNQETERAATFNQATLDRMLAAIVKRADEAKLAGNLDLPPNSAALLARLRKDHEATHAMTLALAEQARKAA